MDLPFRLAAPKPCATGEAHLAEAFDVPDHPQEAVEECVWCKKIRYYDPNHGWSDWYTSP
jgi:hypothetical protein